MFSTGSILVGETEHHEMQVMACKLLGFPDPNFPAKGCTLNRSCIFELCRLKSMASPRRRVEWDAH